jgi:hypothetical protein
VVTAGGAHPIKQPDLELAVAVVAATYTHTAAAPDTLDKDTKAAQEYGKDLDKPAAVVVADLLEQDNRVMEMQVVPVVLELPYWDST